MGRASLRKWMPVSMLALRRHSAISVPAQPQPRMNPDIAMTLGVVVLVLIAFLKEWSAPEVIALTTLCLVTGLGLVPMDKMAEVFKNEAPITIAALFVIGGALEITGAVGRIGMILKKRLSGGLRASMLGISLLTATASAFMNNTAIVAILMPVVLGFARSRDFSAGRLLMPLSYASILGGCCTLIGTSTNLLANGVLKDLNQPALSMFELAPIGIPVAIVGVAYLVLLGPKLIPARSSATAMLDTKFRTKPLHHVLVHPESPLIGMRWVDSPLAAADAGIHVLEVRRAGHRVVQDLSELVIQRFDRFLIAFHGKKDVDLDRLENTLGLEQISAIDGIVTELVIDHDSSIVGLTLKKSHFRQRYNAVVLAVHRNGKNITRQLATIPLEAGDTLLVVTPAFNLSELQDSHDFVLTDSPDTAEDFKKGPALFSAAALVGAVLVTTLTDFLHGHYPQIPSIPIHYAALVGALLLLWFKVITPRDAYQAIDWQVLFMLYGLLGLGMAMQSTGTAKFLANGMVDLVSSHVSQEMLPYVLLWGVFLLTLALTEVLSNNATAVMMIPLVVPLAEQADVSARPFSIAVILAASMAFALPMGYQTHLMVYGPGGFRFSDFLRVGLPLNALCWITACTLIPFIWPF